MSRRSVSVETYSVDSLPDDVMNGRKSYYLTWQHTDEHGRLVVGGAGVYARHDYSGYYHYLQRRVNNILYKVYIGTAGRINRDDILTAIRKLYALPVRAK